MIIKGWTNRRDVYVISKAYECIDFSTVVEMLESVKSGPDEGHIRMPGGKMLEYNRYSNGRIIIRQLA